MSQWAGKYIIGLTGNIGTGKSIVRKMLEHLGAYGIDADALSHRVIAKGAPGYQPVLQEFGKWILNNNGEIDRSKLAKIVFNDPQALKELEAIIHPLVNKAIDFLIQRAPQKVVVIEAIKLLEANINSVCDSVWVVYTPPRIQFARLIEKRKMTETEARARIRSQAPQEEKIAAASVVIRNESTYLDTWKQVLAAWQKQFPQTGTRQLQTPATHDTISIQQGKPRDAYEIAEFVNKLNIENAPLSQENIMAAFGDRAFLLCRIDKMLVGVIGWQVENLITRIVNVYIDPCVDKNKVLQTMLKEIEKASHELQCEAALLFIPTNTNNFETAWYQLGYKQCLPKNLGVLAWQEAAMDSMPADSTLYFKQLRQDRILRPI